MESLGNTFLISFWDNKDGKKDIITSSWKLSAFDQYFNERFKIKKLIHVKKIDCGNGNINGE